MLLLAQNWRSSDEDHFHISLPNFFAEAKKNIHFHMYIMHRKSPSLSMGEEKFTWEQFRSSNVYIISFV